MACCESFECEFGDMWRRDCWGVNGDGDGRLAKSRSE